MLSSARLQKRDGRRGEYKKRALQNEVLTVFDRIALSPDEVCGLLVGDACATTYDPEHAWNVSLPDVPKPPVEPLKPPEVRSLCSGAWDSD